jgi:hypothetical protein
MSELEEPEEPEGLADGEDELPEEDPPDDEPLEPELGMLLEPEPLLLEPLLPAPLLLEPLLPEPLLPELPDDPDGLEPELPLPLPV